MFVVIFLENVHIFLFASSEIIKMKKTVKDSSSELRKRIKQLEASRDRWKEDHKKDQIVKKRLREKAQDEISRRDRWKTDFQKAQACENILKDRIECLEDLSAKGEREKAELQKELEEVKKRLNNQS